MIWSKKLIQIFALIFLTLSLASCEEGCVEADEFDVQSVIIESKPVNETIYGTYDANTGGQRLDWHDTGLRSNGDLFLIQTSGQWMALEGSSATDVSLDALPVCNTCAKGNGATNCICYIGQTSAAEKTIAGVPRTDVTCTGTNYADQNDPTKCTCTADPQYGKATDYGIFHFSLNTRNKDEIMKIADLQTNCKYTRGMGAYIALFGSRGIEVPLRAYHLFSQEEICNVVRDSQGRCRDAAGNDATRYVFRSANNRIFMKDDGDGNTGIDNNTGNDIYHGPNEVIKTIMYDSYYNDNYGKYNIRILRGVGNANESGLLEFIVSLVEEVVLGEIDSNGDRKGGIIEFMYKAIVQDSGFILVVQLCLTLYIVLFGAAHLFGVVEINKKELFSRVLKIGLVVFFSSKDSWYFYNKIVVKFFKEGMDYAVAVMMDLSDSNVDQSSLIKVSQMDRANNISNATRFSYVDIIIKKLMSLGTAKKVFGLFMVDAFGWLYIPMIYALIGYFIYVMLVVASMYLVNLIKIVFVLSLGPIFICFTLFKQTAGMFRNWVGFLGGRSLEILILFAVLYNFLLLIDKNFTGLLSYRVCGVNDGIGPVKMIVLKAQITRSFIDWAIGIVTIGGLIFITKLVIDKVPGLSNTMFSLKIDGETAKGVAAGTGAEERAAANSLSGLAGKMMGSLLDLTKSGAGQLKSAAFMAGRYGIKGVTGIARSTGIADQFNKIGDAFPFRGPRTLIRDNIIDDAINTAAAQAGGATGKARDMAIRSAAVKALQEQIYSDPNKMALAGVDMTTIMRRMDQKLVQEPLKDFLKAEAKRMQDRAPDKITFGKEAKDELRKAAMAWANNNLAGDGASKVAEYLKGSAMKDLVRSSAELDSTKAAKLFAGNSEMQNKYLQHLKDNEFRTANKNINPISRAFSRAYHAVARDSLNNPRLTMENFTRKVGYEEKKQAGADDAKKWWQLPKHINVLDKKIQGKDLVNKTRENERNALVEKLKGGAGLAPDKDGKTAKDRYRGSKPNSKRNFFQDQLRKMAAKGLKKQIKAIRDLEKKGQAAEAAARKQALFEQSKKDFFNAKNDKTLFEKSARLDYLYGAFGQKLNNGEDPQAALSRLMKENTAARADEIAKKLKDGTMTAKEAEKAKAELEKAFGEGLITNKLDDKAAREYEALFGDKAAASRAAAALAASSAGAPISGSASAPASGSASAPASGSASAPASSSGAAPRGGSSSAAPSSSSSAPPSSGAAAPTDLNTKVNNDESAIRSRLADLNAILSRAAALEASNEANKAAANAAAASAIPPLKAAAEPVPLPKPSSSAAPDAIAAVKAPVVAVPPILPIAEAVVSSPESKVIPPVITPVTPRDNIITPPASPDFVKPATQTTVEPVVQAVTRPSPVTPPTPQQDLPTQPATPVENTPAVPPVIVPPTTPIDNINLTPPASPNAAEPVAQPQVVRPSPVTPATQPTPTPPVPDAVPAPTKPAIAETIAPFKDPTSKIPEVAKVSPPKKPKIVGSDVKVDLPAVSPAATIAENEPVQAVPRTLPLTPPIEPTPTPPVEAEKAPIPRVVKSGSLSDITPAIADAPVVGSREEPNPPLVKSGSLLSNIDLPTQPTTPEEPIAQTQPKVETKTASLAKDPPVDETQFKGGVTVIDLDVYEPTVAKVAIVETPKPATVAAPPEPLKVYERVGAEAPTKTALKRKASVADINAIKKARTNESGPVEVVPTIDSKATQKPVQRFEADLRKTTPQDITLNAQEERSAEPVAKNEQPVKLVKARTLDAIEPKPAETSISPAAPAPAEISSVAQPVTGADRRDEEMEQPATPKDTTPREEFKPLVEKPTVTADIRPEKDDKVLESDAGDKNTPTVKTTKPATAEPVRTTVTSEVSATEKPTAPATGTEKLAVEPATVPRIEVTTPREKAEVKTPEPITTPTVEEKKTPATTELPRTPRTLADALPPVQDATTAVTPKAPRAEATTPKAETPATPTSARNESSGEVPPVTGTDKITDAQNKVVRPEQPVVTQQSNDATEPAKVTTAEATTTRVNDETPVTPRADLTPPPTPLGAETPATPTTEKTTVVQTPATTEPTKTLSDVPPVQDQNVVTPRAPDAVEPAKVSRVEDTTQREEDKPAPTEARPVAAETPRPKTTEAPAAEPARAEPEALVRAQPATAEPPNLPNAEVTPPVAPPVIGTNKDNDNKFANLEPAEATAKPIAKPTAAEDAKSEQAAASTTTREDTKPPVEQPVKPTVAADTKIEKGEKVPESQEQSTPTTKRELVTNLDKQALDQLHDKTGDLSKKSTDLNVEITKLLNDIKIDSTTTIDNAKKQFEEAQAQLKQFEAEKKEVVVTGLVAQSLDVQFGAKITDALLKPADIGLKASTDVLLGIPPAKDGAVDPAVINSLKIAGNQLDMKRKMSKMDSKIKEFEKATLETELKYVKSGTKEYNKIISKITKLDKEVEQLNMETKQYESQAAEIDSSIKAASPTAA